MSIPGFIRRNWKLKVGCCVIAFFTWVGVVYAGNPPETKVVSLSVPQSTASIPPSYVLVHAVDPVQVRVGGDQNTPGCAQFRRAHRQRRLVGGEPRGHLFDPHLDCEHRSEHRVDRPPNVGAGRPGFVRVKVCFGHDSDHQPDPGRLRKRQPTGDPLDGDGPRSRARARRARSARDRQPRQPEGQLPGTAARPRLLEQSSTEQRRTHPLLRQRQHRDQGGHHHEGRGCSYAHRGEPVSRSLPDRDPCQPDHRDRDRVPGSAQHARTRYRPHRSR